MAQAQVRARSVAQALAWARTRISAQLYAVQRARSKAQLAPAHRAPLALPSEFPKFCCYEMLLNTAHKFNLKQLFSIFVYKLMFSFAA